MQRSAGMMGAVGLAAGLSIGLSIGFSYMTTGADDPAAPEQLTASTGPSGTIDIGLVLPATGDVSWHGYDNGLAAQLALEDFNRYLDKIDAGWEFNLVVEDSQSDPVVALEKIQSLNSKGIKLVLGTETSAELRNVRNYAESNGMLLISPSSSSSALSIDDRIFRLVPDDTQQGRVTASLLESRGITAAIPVYRGDVWGDGLYKTTKGSFESRGGTLDEGIRYSPESAVFSTEAHLLNERLGEYLQERPASEVAIVMMGFEEAVHFFNAASPYDGLSSVLWTGTDALTNNGLLVEDPIATAFMEEVGFVSAQFAASQNDRYEHVKKELTSQIGSSPNSFAYSSYDSLWLLGMSILQVQSADPELISVALPTVARHHSGSLGPIILNDAGDLAASDYELYTVRGGEWVAYGMYKADTEKINSGTL
ncbi:ABC-type branched-chain amino acid transport system, periplasmic component [Cenarchaeum symbiosum A]|uniref:ABC-type branched-chain amino acid transport system, periplasmic component n=1 Tax=Cenarchaeum symbiosum (strain A) TaxID=414004 RepID=A0RV82_CENSY|nr:ABC-type branched-chain amino acid transport system, periplasmic component [Cenarchaeum symbiosum A]